MIKNGDLVKIKHRNIVGKIEINNYNGKWTIHVIKPKKYIKHFFEGNKTEDIEKYCDKIDVKKIKLIDIICM